MKTLSNYQIIGWREWVALPELGIEKIKAKADTGARTSALHAFRLEMFNQHHKQKVRFAIHPLQGNTHLILNCIADVVDMRWVSDSGGHLERRYVIQTLLVIGDCAKTIEITLTNRDTMNFRMLLGRGALKKTFLVNPSRSFMTRKI